MAESWDYAKLTALAKKHRGPEGLVNFISDSNRAAGREQGHQDMYPALALLFAAGYGTSWLVKWGKQGVKWLQGKYAKRKATADEVEAAKQALIQGIREYDATHPADSTMAESVDESVPEANKLRRE